MFLSLSPSTSDLGTISTVHSHASVSFNHCCVTQLVTSKPRCQKKILVPFQSSTAAQISNLGLGFSDCCRTVKLGGSMRRSRKLGFLSREQGKNTSSVGWQVGNFESDKKFLARNPGRSSKCCEVKLRSWDISVRSKSVLGVDEMVETDGKGVSRGSYYDAIVIGSGIGGLVAATQLAVKGAKVLVLEKYVIPGGSSGFYEKDGYTFDVGSSVMFGFSDKVSFVSFFLSILSSVFIFCPLVSLLSTISDDGYSNRLIAGVWRSEKRLSPFYLIVLESLHCYRSKYIASIKNLKQNLKQKQN